MKMKVSSNGIFNLIKYLKIKHKNRVFITELLEDLIQSGLVTIILYITIIISLYLIFQSTQINDPSDKIPFECTINDKHYSNDMINLITYVNSILNTTSQKYFICYRTLYEQLKLKPDYHNKNQIDLCVYDKHLNPTNIENNLFSSLITSNFEFKLDLFKQQNHMFNYYLNRMLGYYHLNLNNANIYLYVFINSPENKYEFESIRRNGYLYLQFDYLNKLFSNKKFVAYKLPYYMIENEMFKTRLANNYIAFPNDVYSFLMHSYPHDWFKFYENCSN